MRAVGKPSIYIPGGKRNKSALKGTLLHSTPVTIHDDKEDISATHHTLQYTRATRARSRKHFHALCADRE